jgi:hypothetical protein
MSELIRGIPTLITSQAATIRKQQAEIERLHLQIGELSKTTSEEHDYAVRLKGALERLCYWCEKRDVVRDEVLRARTALKGKGDE